MQHPNQTDHARHDATLIAGHAAGGLGEADRARADAQLAVCDECAELRRDLVAIAAATRSVPAPATLGRDLRLAPEQAERLRRGSWLRTILRPFGTAGSPIRPMAAAFTSLGVVGLVVGVTFSSGAQLAGTAAPPASGGDSRQETVYGEWASAAPAAAPVAPTLDAAAENYAGQILTASDGTLYVVRANTDGSLYLESAAPRPAFDAMRSTKPTGEEPDRTEFALGAANNGGEPAGEADDAASRNLSQPPNPLIAGSLALLGIGLLLFGLRLASTRVR